MNGVTSTTLNKLVYEPEATSSLIRLDRNRSVMSEIFL